RAVLSFFVPARWSRGLRDMSVGAHKNLRRTQPKLATSPPPKSSKLPGSGVLPVPVAVPIMVNDSEGSVPRPPLSPSDGQPGEWQPMPLFSSQYTGLPSEVTAFCRFTQYSPLFNVGPLKVPVSVQTL